MNPAVLRDSVGNLPADRNSFVGRRRELSTARALLTSGRLLTLTGMGGVGKTRLARRLLGDVHRAFRDGVWQVELAELHEPALVATTVASTMGLHAPPGGWTIGALQERLAGRHLLLLLDNCEHLLDACAVTVDALLGTCPDLHVVATSRQPLGIDGEQTLAIAPLPTPNPEQSTDLLQLQEFDATKLFLARAGAVLPGFVIDRQNQRAVAALCHRLDGLPLALEFAALQVRALSLEQIVARLDHDSRLSVKGHRVASARQQSLRALVDWSFQLCSEPEQVVWSRLSVFTDSFDLEAAGFVCAEAIPDADLVDLVVGLVEKSVLSRESDDGRVSYRMAQVIRDYGREQLDEAEERSARRRHRDWYVSLAAQAYAEYPGPEQLRWFVRLRREHPDIRAALAFCLADVDGAEPATDILLSLLDYWLNLGLLSEGKYWVEQLLDRTPQPDALRARLLRAKAHLAVFDAWNITSYGGGVQGEEATAILEEAHSLAVQAGSETELAWITLCSSVAASASGDLATASRLVDDVLIGLRTAGDLHCQAGAVATQAVLAAMSGDLVAAEARGEELQVLTGAGERWLRSYVVWALGMAAWRTGDHRRAAELATECMSLRLPFNDPLGLSQSAEVLAWVIARDGDSHKAAVLLGAARQAAEAIGASVPVFRSMVDDHERCMKQLQAELGGAALEAALRRGGELRAEEVLDLATGRKGVASVPEADEGGRLQSPLTRREQEIAQLVAQGLSNKDIAKRLVIAPRTAEGHVEHILVKLGFNSRSQVAAWIAQGTSEGSR